MSRRRDLVSHAARAAHVAALPTPTELRAEADEVGGADAYGFGALHLANCREAAGRLRERADVLAYLHDLVANCDREGGPHNALLAGFFATTANEIAGGVHLADKADGGTDGA